MQSIVEELATVRNKENPKKHKQLQIHTLQVKRKGAHRSNKRSTSKTYIRMPSKADNRRMFMIH